MYPVRTPPGGRLAEYVKHFATVEIDSTFYGTPRRSTVERWREAAPEGFLFAAKFPREITHEKNLVEVRHRSWNGSELPGLLRERGAALTLVDYPGMPRLEEATAGFSYIRWLGDRREFPAGHTHLKKERVGDLRHWSGVVDRFLEEGKSVFANANNHYQNHSPSTVEEFLKIRWGERG